ncbi:MAG: dihydropteroate synthase [Bacteroidota bacterium]
MPAPLLDTDHPLVLDARGHALDCRPVALRSTGAHVMGILNVTPDSFSDGGRFLGRDAALRHAEQMIEEGARLIDIGGESSRPKGKTYGAGATPVEADEERRRVLPVIEALAAQFPETLLSIDTYKPEVAAAALDAGAHVVNDITGGRFSSDMPKVAARYGAPYIVMHSLGTPGAMPHETLTLAGGLDDPVASVRASLASSVAQAEAAGVRDVVVDPGFGFGKTTAANLALIGYTEAFVALGRPVLVGVSRKSSIGAALGTADAPAPVEARLFGSLGATAVAVLQGAALVRTHDVQATAEMLRVLAAIDAVADRPTGEGAA